MESISDDIEESYLITNVKMTISQFIAIYHNPFLNFVSQFGCRWKQTWREAGIDIFLQDDMKSCSSLCNLYRSLKFIFGAGGMKEQHISKFLQGEISYHSQPITITGDLINLWKTWEFYWISSRTETGYYFNRFLQVTETSRTHWNGGNFLPADEMGEVIWPISIFQRERLGFEDDKWLRCLWELGYLLPSRKYVCKSTICRYYRLTPDRCVENKAPFCCGVAVSETGESIYAQWYGFHIEAERRGWASA